MLTVMTTAAKDITALNHQPRVGVIQTLLKVFDPQLRLPLCLHCIKKTSVLANALTNEYVRTKAANGIVAVGILSLTAIDPSIQLIVR